MEQSRLIIAIAVSFGIFLAWSFFFAPKTPENVPEVVQTQTESTQQQAAAQASDSVDAPPADFQVAAVDTEANRKAKTITVDHDLYRITLSEKGASVIAMTLRRYKETVDDDSPNKELLPDNLKIGTVSTSLEDGELKSDLSDKIFTADTTASELYVDDRDQSIVFTYQLPSGIIVEKVYRFRPHTYLIDVEVTLKNNRPTPFSGALTMGLTNMFPESKKKMYGFLGPSALVDNKLKQIALKKVPENELMKGEVKWIGVEKLYFMSSLVLDQPLAGRIKMAYEKEELKNQLILDTGEIVSGGNRTYQFSLFMGPKNWSLLRSFHNDLARAIHFGWFDFLAKPCLWFMNFIYRFIPNYGVAIIILTLVTRLIFWPLAQKSYKSMGAMRKLAPLMQEIREKYKDDKARINQETMALYRTYKINPVSGCLPMVIQLPVFFALYRMLYSAIELRHAPFFGWIHDLSAPDRLFHFDFRIPFMEEPTGIPVMTIIMGVTMLLQQKMTPTTGDPTQARMMMIMPIVFMVIFINFSSGLVLYWLIGNVFAIAQQYFTQKKLA